MQGIADRVDLGARINACVYYQSLINPFNIDMKSELGSLVAVAAFSIFIQ